jgi:predicted porin
MEIQMTKRQFILGLTSLVLGPSLSVSMAQAEQPPSDDLAKKVESLEQEVRELKSQRATTPPYTARDVDTVTTAVLDDASRHTLGFPPGGSSGHDLDKGFFIKSDDGNFTIYPDLLLQFRGVANDRQDAKKSGSSSAESGFEMRRAKIGFYGTAFSPDLSFRFLWQDTVTGGGLSLQYGFAQYTFAHHVVGNGDLAIKVGQFKNIVFKEEFTPDRAQLMVERSLANALLGGAALGSETQGVSVLLTGAENPFHAELLFDDGIKSSNTDFRDNQPVTVGTTTTNVATDFGVAGRVDYKIFGRWGDADDLTGVWGREDLLVVGGGVDFSQGDNNSTWHYTVDAQYQFLKKFVVLAALYGDHVESRNQPSISDRTDWGAQVEAGYFFTPSLQAIARYSLVKFDHDFKTGGADTFHEISGGVNWFFGQNGQLGNRAKLTIDVNYLPNGSPASPGLDYLASPNNKDEWVVRTQLQFSL